MIRSLHIVPDRDHFRVLVTYAEGRPGPAVQGRLSQLVGWFAAELGLHFGEALTVDAEGSEGAWLGDAWLHALVDKLPPGAIDKLWIQVDTLRRQRSGPHAEHRIEHRSATPSHLPPK